MRGAQPQVDGYVAALVSHGIALRGLSLEEAPLEALFFLLTESAPDLVPTEGGI